MKKIFHLSFAVITAFISTNALSQGYDKCGTNAMIDYNESKYPGYKQHINKNYNEILKRSQQTNSSRSADTYTIPVVVHVVWNTNSPEQNIPDSVIVDQIAVLNEDYSKTNADISNLRSQFDSVSGTANIQFVLACTDPDGNATDGIVRVETSSVFGSTGLLPDMAEVSKIQHDSTGGSDAWDPSRYLNIWVGDINGGSEPSLLGVATPPPNLSNWPGNSTPPELGDGVNIQFQAFGRNNPVPLTIQGSTVVVNGRTVTHEVGHYLGVRHTAENTFGGLLGSVCGDDDGLKDTPTCDQSQQGCDLTRNSCVDTIGSYGDLPDMVENYMDYSDQDCQNSFTKGQVAIMRSVLENERLSLRTSTGLNGCSTTGITEIKKSQFKLYPNPTSGVFAVESYGNSTIYVYNNLGQLVLSKKLVESNKTQIELFTKGIYLVKIENENGVSSQKVIVK